MTGPGHVLSTAERIALAIGATLFGLAAWWFGLVWAVAGMGVLLAVTSAVVQIATRHERRGWRALSCAMEKVSAEDEALEASGHAGPAGGDGAR